MPCRLVSRHHRVADRVVARIGPLRLVILGLGEPDVAARIVVAAALLDTPPAECRKPGFRVPLHGSRPREIVLEEAADVLRPHVWYARGVKVLGDAVQHPAMLDTCGYAAARSRPVPALRARRSGLRGLA